MVKNLISMLDVKENINEIINQAIDLKKKVKNGEKIEILKGKTLGMIFEKSSTRTRASFEAGMTRLGGHAIFLSNTDIQLGRGETIEDTAIVLSRYVDILMYRSKSHKDMRELADNATVPVINGLDNKEHPCQVITDLMTILENKGTLKGLNFVYIGDGGNNMAHSYLLGCAMVGINIKIVSPKKYWPEKYFINEAEKFGVIIEITDKIKDSTKDADIIATDTWISMGDESEKGDMGRAKSMAQQTSRITDEIANQSKDLLKYLGIPFIQAPSEGEAQASYMVKNGDAYGVGSQDFDCLLVGSPILIRNLTSSTRRKLPGKKAYIKVNPELIRLDFNLKQLSISHKQLVDMAILIGTDFNPGVKGLGPKKSLNLIKKVGNIKNAIATFGGENAPTFEEINEIRKIFNNPNITKDYTLKWSKPDNDKILEFLCEEYNFTKSRIEPILEKFENIDTMMKQKTLF